MNVSLADPIRPAAPAPLLPPLARLLPRLDGRMALVVPPLGALAGSAARRRMACTLLAEAAEAGSGQVFETLDGSLLLLGGLPRLVRRAAESLGALAGAPPAAPWLLPRDAPALLAWAERALVPPQPPAAPAALPGLAGLDALLGRLAPEKLLRSRKLQRPQPGRGGGAAPSMAGLRLRLSRPALAAALGRPGADPDLLRHAEDRLAARLLPSLAAWAGDFPGLWLLPLPRAALRAGVELPPGRAGLHGVLPLPALAASGFGAVRQLLADAGWGLALLGPDAAALPGFDLAALPADLLLLRWTPALEDRAPLAALRRADPSRLVLTAADGPAALEFAARLGLAALSGPVLEPPG
ncbi:hypothetical protein [Siccirubricoccus phaeus]|uniref:hypothetical protein n=1 Tax=Siccirubricoccus phaeus TaxID=2595053 RepID=UPI0011F249B5|nr:hypothetical protein [Siccirubricoccus phaeus]